MCLFGIRSPLSGEVEIVQIPLEPSAFETACFIILSCSDAQNNTSTTLRIIIHSANFLVDFPARIVRAKAAIDILKPVDYGGFEIGRCRRCGTSDLPYRYVMGHVRISVKLSLLGVFALVQILISAKQVGLLCAGLALLLESNNDSAGLSMQAS